MKSGGRDPARSRPGEWKTAATALVLAGVLLGLSTVLPARAEAAPENVPPEFPIQPDALTPEMKEWLHRAVPEKLGQFRKLERILVALQHDRDGPRVRYRDGYTGTAQEAFETGWVNCLSFSQLVVAMAREFGIDAFYMEVRKFERFTKEGDLVIVAGHTTAGFDKGPERVILEFAVGPQIEYRDAVKIGDATARAYYHSNRGAELLQFGEIDAALEWLEVAAEVDPSLPDAWVNLGVALRRSGRNEEAEAAYRRAVSLEPEFFPAYQNLAALFRLRGDRDTAGEMLRILERQSSRNPFVYLALGDLSFEQGEYEDARRLYMRGRRLRRRDPELLAAMGAVELALGNLEGAGKWLARAQKRGPENARVMRLAQALDTPPEG